MATELDDDTYEGENAPVSTLGRVLGYLVIAALVVGFALAVFWLRNAKASKFKATALDASEARCVGRAACLTEVSANFEECYAGNHTTKKRRGSRFNVDHHLDQTGLERCLHPAGGPMTLPAPEPAEDAEGEDRE